MKYSQYPYKRINLEEFKKDIQAMIVNFNSADSADNCIGCLENQPNQQAHMGPGGCLYEELDLGEDGMPPCASSAMKLQTNHSQKISDVEN